MRTEITAQAAHATACVGELSEVTQELALHQRGGRAVGGQAGGEGAGFGGVTAAIAGLGLALSMLVITPSSSMAADSGMPGSGPGCTTSTNPSYSVVSCERTGLDRDGRLLGCR